ncbi:2-amino-4-hydroxy-6-hydroxymethyldihydropteridine diphosphokinase [Formicincola oecophyllae]|uniref:Bifunctional folate synthesis protein n=1 Tax=Formicincola oecophyllae TaxID=2558361 RepID=A0A4Y6UAI9_9PROT|nr:2-amino-4-hydroxy-6-hydroxymethyldihydropteridine diphosphokinase [Formicincola oecophyllae]QDH13401.1 2-amino-4-hydroxy-6-hydroxymethyldihydropteridine diphosphokinase [Formicincola oecophyllae]
MIVQPPATIHVDNLQLYGRHGVMEAENRLGQRFVVSLQAEVDVTAAVTGDDYNYAVCYGQLCDIAREVTEGPHLALVETLAARIGERVLARCPLVRRIVVRVDKPGAPVAMAFENVGVTLARSREVPVGFGLGANLANPADTLRVALERLGLEDGVVVDKASSLYQSAPWGVVDQPPFVNAVALGRTTLPPHDLLRLCKALEREGGRVPGRRWGERVLDVDLLFYGQTTHRDAVLTLPHPRFHERAFVLVPLAEVAPELEIAGKTVAQHVQALPRTPGDVTLLEPVTT